MNYLMPLGQPPLNNPNRAFGSIRKYQRTVALPKVESYDYWEGPTTGDRTKTRTPLQSWLVIN